MGFYANFPRDTMRRLICMPRASCTDGDMLAFSTGLPMAPILITVLATIPMTFEAGHDTEIDLYTAALFQQRLASNCRKYGFSSHYQGQISSRYWPVGAEAPDLKQDKPARDDCSSWQILGTPESTPIEKIKLPRLSFMIALSRRKTASDVASFTLDGKDLHLRVTYVAGNRGNDDPLPTTLITIPGVADLTVRKCVGLLIENPKDPLPLSGNAPETKAVDLYTLNYLHHLLWRVVHGESNWLCLYYRGPLAQFESRGRSGLLLPKAANPSLTWTITQLDSDRPEKEHVVFQICLSLKKQVNAIATCNVNSKVFYVSVEQITNGRAPDDKIAELAGPEGKEQRSVREFLRMLDALEK